MKNNIKIIFGVISIYGVLALLTPFSPFLRKRSIENQIKYINKRLQLGGDNILQNRYPEGKVFSNAIFALSTIQYYRKRSVKYISKKDNKN